MELFLLIFCFDKFMTKISWGLQNVLTMECCRKICYKCYWNNVYNKKHSVLKNSVLILISVLPALFMSFFYLPTDPANSAKASSALRSLKLLSYIRLKFGAIIDSISDKIINLPSFYINLSRISSSKGDLFKTYSVLRI
ncbi:MAG: hypothetical protein IPL67_05835 [Ignavibacteria bacterium]|nr:hypothetical protein [Ignavibacteria bacterium]